MSKALLRAARAGCIYIRHIGKDSGEEEKDNAEVEESALITKTEQSFHARKWAVLPKHLEPSEVEFLAKRRSGLPSLYGGAAASNVVSSGTGNGNVQLRKTRFRKIDPDSGKISIYEAWIPEGHSIEGEILDDITVSEQREVAIPNKGTVFEPITETLSSVTAETTVTAPEPVPTASPVKTRLYPPKRKAKGPGKGRRKKVMFAPGEGADASKIHNVVGHPTVALKNGGVTNVPVEAAAIIGYSMSHQVEDDEEDDDEEEEGEEREDGGKESSQPEAKLSEINFPEISIENNRATTTKVHNSTPITEPGERRPFESEIEAATKPEEMPQQQTPNVQQYLPQKRSDSAIAAIADISPRTDARADPYTTDPYTKMSHAFGDQSPLTNTISRTFPPSSVAQSICRVIKVDGDHTVTSQTIESAPPPVVLDGIHHLEMVPVPLEQVTPLDRVIAGDNVIEAADNVSLPALSAIPNAVLQGTEIAMQSGALSRTEEEEADFLSSLGASLADDKAVASTEINISVSSTAIPLNATPAVAGDVNAVASGVRFPTESIRTADGTVKGEPSVGT
jgi:hypothetical protein